MRTVLEKMFAFILRLYFRRVEVYGEKNIPEEGPVIFVLNHQNAMVDPLFILCLAPRPVSFLAKSTLFKTPVLSFFTKAFDSIPVYRKQDEGRKAVGGNNQITFQMCRELLQSGKSLALFPEGISHSETKLQPLKTGTARIALGAASGLEGDLPLRIVPAGLYYSAKQTFRSEALIYYGEPFEVEAVVLDENSEPPREATYKLTEQLKVSLEKVMLEAHHEEALSLIHRAESIYNTPNKNDDEEHFLAGRVERQKRFVQVYEELHEKHKVRLDAVKLRIEEYEAELARWGVTLKTLKAENFTFMTVLKFILKRLLIMPLLSPLAIVGVLVHYPIYRMIGHLSKRLGKSDLDMFSTIKILGSMLFFPLLWLFLSGGLLYVYTWKIALVALLFLPVTGWSAIFFAEHFEDLLWRSRTFALFLQRRKVFDSLLKERESIRQEIISLGELSL